MSNELDQNGHTDGNYSSCSAPNAATADNNGEGGLGKANVAEEKVEELRRLLGKSPGDVLKIAGVGAGAWGSVFVALLQDAYGCFRDKVQVRIWRRAGRAVDRATAEHLFEVINSREDVLRRLIRRCAYLKYVEARLGDRVLYADEILKDGFCLNMIDTPLCPLKVVTNLQEAIWDADVVINGLPSTETKEVFEEISRYWKERRTVPIIISLAKGVEAALTPVPHIITPTQMIHRATGVPIENILYLGGPNIASEIYHKEYANARICGSDKWRKALANFLRQPHFIVWDNNDLVTHEVMGGLKNVYAIGAGMVAALTNESATSKSVYFAHCTSEMIFITHLLSEEPEKLAGPLLADTYVTLLKGRNAWYGQMLAKGELRPDMGDSIKGKGMIQGVSAVGAFYELLRQPSLSLMHPDGNKPVAPVELCPILKTLYRILGKELSARGALVAAKQRFESLVAIDRDGDMHLTRGKCLLATFARPFSELESFDQKLPSFGNESSKTSSANQIEIVSSGFSGFESVWRATHMLKDHTFFVWKVGVIDAFLDSCIRNLASAVDHTLGFDQIVSIQKRKLEIQIQYYLDQYLRERLAPVLLECLEKEEDSLKYISAGNRELESNIAKKELEAVKRAQGLLVEYSNAHETARAAKAAASAMKLQVRELNQDLQKAKLEAAQLEWLHDYTLSLPEEDSILTQGCANEDKLPSSFIKLNRKNLLENIRSAMSAINRATEDLRNCERSAVSTEEQLERAMGWACAGPSTGGGSNNSSRGTGIPPEFHEHLRCRQQLLLAGKEQASGILKLCSAVSDFEDSRDGFLRSLSDVTPGGSLSDGKGWQQALVNIVSRLDHCYNSFTRADREWHLAQKSMEAATASLSAATNDLCLVSIKSKAASGELQATLSSMRDWVVKASEELSAFCRVARSNSALTTETGLMLEEVLAITDGAEGAHDVYRLAKDAAAQHSNLMSELNKVTFLLLPLESTLASASSAIIGLINREGGQKLEILPGQGQAIFQSLHSNLGEVRPILKTVVPVLLNTVKELHIALTRLARTASFDAGVLHKALEGVGESQEARSQELDLAGPELDGDEVLSENQDRDIAEAVGDNDENVRESLTDEELLLQPDEESWISPPDSLDTSESESDVSSSQSIIFQNQEDPLGIFNDWESHISGAEKTKFSGGGLEDISRYTVNEDILFTSPSFLAHSQEDPALVARIGTDVRFDVRETGDNWVCIGSNQIHFSKGASKRLEGSQASISSTKAGSESLSTTHMDMSETGLGSLNAAEKHQTGELQQGMKLKEFHLTPDKGRVGSYKDLYNLFSSMKTEQRSHTFRGKNAYAVSVLKRVEAKLKGQEIEGKRQFSVSEQVDHLLRQATSIDNLCNMYEGWTPWI